MAHEVEGVCTSIALDGNPLPLFITPKDGNDSVYFLKQWVKNNKAWLEKKVLEHGKSVHRLRSVEYLWTVLLFESPSVFLFNS